MAGRIVKQARAAITAATATGYVTVASVSGFYKSAKGSINKAGQDTKNVIITEVLTGTNQLGIRFVDEMGDGPRYGRDDVSAYDGGTITMQAQFVFNPNDKPLD